MLHGEPDLLVKIVRDVFNEDFSKLIVDGEEPRATIERYLEQVAPDLLDRLERWQGSGDVFTAHRVHEQIEKALDRKVWLPSGGSLVIDRTEAMTVIDVNTGKFVGSGGNLEETVTKNNLEAAEEIVRQLRLRDIGGIIVVDFIDMVLETNRDLVLRRLVECLSRDRTKHQVAEVTSLGLVQMTRKRLGVGPRGVRRRRQLEPGEAGAAAAAAARRRGGERQRRRDGRDTARRRTVVTEAEFLARRESVDRVMLVRTSGDRVEIGVLEDGILAEHYVAKSQNLSLIGNVYLGRVQNVLPSMEAAFVDIGRGRNAVLYSGEVDWEAASDRLGDKGSQSRKIELALRSGDQVLVQVTKDPIGHKGARLTSAISLPGRYLVYVPNGSMSGISRKLPDTERARLKKILKDALPDSAGVIVRTAAEGATEEQLTIDVQRLANQWAEIEHLVETASGADDAARRAGPARQDRARRVQRGLLEADRGRRGAARDHRALPRAGRPRPARPPRALAGLRATSSPRTACTSRSRRRSTARSGCRRAARSSSTAPRR